LANLDADAELEVVLNTAHSGFVAYDLPGTEHARLLWATGRGNYQRTGSILHGTLGGSSKRVEPMRAVPGAVLTYTIRLENPGPDLPGVWVTDELPLQVHYLGNLQASAGAYGEAGGIITWTGAVAAGEPVTITFGVSVAEGIASPQTISNTALLDDGLGHEWQRSAVVMVNGYVAYLPLAWRR
jgi:uncharacterized repeat protein (TIGR01451 family)